MGLFDYVNFSTPCPECKSIIDYFQTKDGPGFCNETRKLEISETRYFYTFCKVCKAWIEFIQKLPKNINDFDLNFRK